jgi:hypothetical protein
MSKFEEGRGVLDMNKLDARIQLLSEGIVFYTEVLAKSLRDHRRDNIIHQWVALLGAALVTISLGLKHFPYGTEVALVTGSVMTISKGIDLIVNFDRKIRITRENLVDMIQLGLELNYAVAGDRDEWSPMVGDKIEELYTRYIDQRSKHINDFNSKENEFERSV